MYCHSKNNVCRSEILLAAQKLCIATQKYALLLRNKSFRTKICLSTPKYCIAATTFILPLLDICIATPKKYLAVPKYWQLRNYALPLRNIHCRSEIFHRRSKILYRRSEIMCCHADKNVCHSKILLTTTKLCTATICIAAPIKISSQPEILLNSPQCTYNAQYSHVIMPRTEPTLKMIHMYNYNLVHCNR